MKNNTIPECYELLIPDLPDSDRDNIPDYDISLHHMYLKKISYSTMSRWMKNLGFKYCENQKYNYTDGHESDDVARDRNDKFLIQYVDAKLLAYRWVQLDEATA